MQLAGRKVLVTGAGRGVGAALVDAALARHAATVLAGVRSAVALPEWSADERVLPVRLDVVSANDIAAVAGDHPEVDLIVCNAGVTCQRPVLDDIDEAAFREVLEVNFFGPLRLVRAYAAALQRQGTGVIFVLSVSGILLSRSAPVYSASKAACLMLALGLREQLTATGATVTVVLPGFIDTDMGAAFDSPKASPRQIAERSLDGWLAGESTVWPDRFAELVRDAIGEPMHVLLDRPREIASALQATFLADPDAGR
jgi:NAD(P)-dependent dehydrogenase (short-subunit alcohol dehydrogenase family)